MGILTIDIGTSTLKVLAFDESGRVLAREQVSYQTKHPQPGWAEQSPEDWWQATLQGTRVVVARVRELKEPITGIGLTGQMHGPVLLAEDGRILFPCMLWMDTRAQNEAAEITRAVGHERMLAITGNPAVAALPAAKLLWLRRHIPKVYQKIWKVLMPKDYLAWRLAGELITDPSDASGTGLYDLRHNHWANELVELVGVPQRALPPVARAGQLLGRVPSKVARQMGLPKSIPVFIGAGDLVTAALGNGIARPGTVALIIGTAGQLLFQLDEWPSAILGKLYLFAYAVPESFLGLGTVPTGGASLNWLARLITGNRCSTAEAISKWLEQARKVPPGSRGLVFLPYLAGTGTPYMDYHARGAFIGLTESHGPAEFVRAVLEGVAYSLRDSFEILKKLDKDFGRTIRMGGGATITDLWLEIVAGVMGREVSCVELRDASSIGAFILAAVGCGYYEDISSACEAVVKLKEPIVPTRPLVRQYEERYQVFRRLYKELKQVLAGSLSKDERILNGTENAGV